MCKCEACMCHRKIIIEKSTNEYTIEFNVKEFCNKEIEKPYLLCEMWMISTSKEIFIFIFVLLLMIAIIIIIIIMVSRAHKNVKSVERIYRRKGK